MPRPTLPVLLCLLTSCGSMAYVPSSNADFEACKQLLLQQAEAWNRGELEVFVLGYRKSPQTVFAGEDELHVGFDAMLARYLEAYPDPASMGRLRFEDLAFLGIDDDHLLGRGTWIIDRPDGERWGRFGLMFRREHDIWKIAYDYTTREHGTRPTGAPATLPKEPEGDRTIDPADLGTPKAPASGGAEQG
ncbi:MAG: hypothetical protein R3F30_07760 [Planctomycetota bacterium]